LTSKIKVRPNWKKKSGTVKEGISLPKEQNVADYNIVLQTKGHQEICSKKGSDSGSIIMWRGVFNPNNRIVEELFEGNYVLDNMKECSKAAELFDHTKDKGVPVAKYTEAVNRLCDFRQRCKWENGQLIITVDGPNLKSEDLRIIFSGILLFYQRFSTEKNLIAENINEYNGRQSIVSQLEVFLQKMTDLKRIGEKLNKEYPDGDFSKPLAQIDELLALYEQNRMAAEAAVSEKQKNLTSNYSTPCAGWYSRIN
jgi:hypothetical protein